jgi:DNA-binding transcriptional ArsR family regulator
MTEALSDRLFETLGDPAAREVLRCLLEGDRSQTEIIAELGLAQPTASRAIRVLRAAGLVTASSGRRRERLRLEAPANVAAVLLATDRLAEEILHAQVSAQHDRSAATRRSAIKPAEKRSAANPDTNA